MALGGRYFYLYGLQTDALADVTNEEDIKNVETKPP
jgi:hypothetical protein